MAALRIPLWARWALSLTVAAALLVALIVFVDRHNSNGSLVQSPRAIARANQEAEIVVKQDEAPHVITLTSAGDPHAVFLHAIRADMTRRIAEGIIDGTLQRLTCARHGQSGSRLRFSCTATAADVNYEFVGVIEPTARRLIYCKRDPPPVPSQNIPLSPRCQP
ncbi:MAG: hypothetical protein WAL63_22220 [Solirubrobacteraceae bacterium]